MTAAVVELDPLADPVRAAPENDDLRARRRIGFTLLLERAVHVGRERLELRRAGVDPLVGRDEPGFAPARADAVFVDAHQQREIGVGEAGTLQIAEEAVGQIARAHRRRGAAELDDLVELREEPADRCASAAGSRRAASRARWRGTPPTCAGRSECPAPAAASRRLPRRRPCAGRRASRSCRARAIGTPSGTLP